MENEKWKMKSPFETCCLALQRGYCPELPVMYNASTHCVKNLWLLASNGAHVRRDACVPS